MRCSRPGPSILVCTENLDCDLFFQMDETFGSRRPYTAPTSELATIRRNVRGVRLATYAWTVPELTHHRRSCPSRLFPNGPTEKSAIAFLPPKRSHENHGPKTSFKAPSTLRP